MEQKIRSSESRVRSASPLATNGTQEARLHYTRRYNLVFIPPFHYTINFVY